MDAMEHCRNRRPRVERLFPRGIKASARTATSPGELDDPLIDASASTHKTRCPRRPTPSAVPQRAPLQAPSRRHRSRCAVDLRPRVVRQPRRTRTDTHSSFGAVRRRRHRIRSVLGARHPPNHGKQTHPPATRRRSRRHPPGRHPRRATDPRLAHHQPDAMTGWLRALFGPKAAVAPSSNLICIRF